MIFYLVYESSKHETKISNLGIDDNNNNNKKGYKSYLK